MQNALFHEEVHFLLVLNNHADLITGLTIHNQNKHLSHLVMLRHWQMASLSTWTPEPWKSERDAHRIIWGWWPGTDRMWSCWMLVGVMPLDAILLYPMSVLHCHCHLKDIHGTSSNKVGNQPIPSYFGCQSKQNMLVCPSWQEKYHWSSGESRDLVSLAVQAQSAKVAP